MLALLLIVIGFSGGLLLKRITLGQVIVRSDDSLRMASTIVRTGRRQDCTTSSVFVDMPETAVTFRTDTPGPVVVLFSTTLMRQTARAGRFRFRFVVNMAPGATVWTIPLGDTGDSGSSVGRTSVHFTTDPLPPGEHVIGVQWSSHPDSQELCLGRRDLIVLHR